MNEKKFLKLVLVCLAISVCAIFISADKMLHRPMKAGYTVAYFRNNTLELEPSTDVIPLLAAVLNNQQAEETNFSVDYYWNDNLITNQTGIAVPAQEERELLPPSEIVEQLQQSKNTENVYKLEVKWDKGSYTIYKKLKNNI